MEDGLKLTIQKIKLLAEQNTEFRQEMQKLFGNAVSASTDSNEERISQIEKYLGLDYFVDSMPALIDYSYIGDSEIRAQLISDNREMLRYRYGTRFHLIKFDEFCRYAQLQAEMIINYFYYKVYGKIDKIIEHIKLHNPTGYISDKVKNIGEIAFNTKLWAFEDEFKLNTYTTLDNVRKVRNEQSHRSPKEIDFSILEYQKKLSEWHIALKEEGSVNWLKTQNDTLGKNLYETKVKDTKEYKLYCYLIWLKQEPFDEIIGALTKLSACIKNEIK